MENTPLKKTNKKTMVVIVAIVAFIILDIIISYNFLRSRNDKKTISKSTDKSTQSAYDSKKSPVPPSIAHSLSGTVTSVGQNSIKVQVGSSDKEYELIVSSQTEMFYKKNTGSVIDPTEKKPTLNTIKARDQLTAEFDEDITATKENTPLHVTVIRVVIPEENPILRQ